MKQDDIETFPPEVIEKLNYYVYRLIDPRNGETFYVGKGRGNRVFAHIREQVDDDDIDPKLKRIREIVNSGFEVAHVIHRHGMDEKTALEVEAAVMDAYPGLTNLASGYGSGFGVLHAREVIARYHAEVAVFKHKAILIIVNRTAAETSLYEATRYAWKISRKRTLQAEIILPVAQGLIVGAYVAEKWLDATPENFQGREAVPGRLGFIGHEADTSIKQLYIGKRVPDEYRKKGAANPIKFTWSNL